MLVRTTWKVWGKANCFSAENQSFGPSILWKGLFVAREVRGWCLECQFLHHEGRRVSSKSPEWCKNCHEWHHPLTSSATKSPFQRSRRPKRNWFSAEKQFAATRTFHVVLTNMIGCFFILVKGFCNSFFFYLIPYGSLKTAPNVVEIPGSHLWQI